MLVENNILGIRYSVASAFFSFCVGVKSANLLWEYNNFFYV